MKLDVFGKQMIQAQAWITFRDIEMEFIVDRPIKECRFVLKSTKPKVGRLSILEEYIYLVSWDLLDKEWAITIRDKFQLWRLAMQVVFDAIDKISKDDKPVFTAYDNKITKEEKTTDKYYNEQIQPIVKTAKSVAQSIPIESRDIFGDWDKMIFAKEEDIVKPQVETFEPIKTAKPINIKPYVPKNKVKGVNTVVDSTPLSEDDKSIEEITQEKPKKLSKTVDYQKLWKALINSKNKWIKIR